MADGAIDRLSIEIGASSTKAVTNINNLAGALRELRVAVSVIDSGSAAKINSLAEALSNLKGIGSLHMLDKLPTQLTNIAIATGSIAEDTISKLDRLTSALEKLRGVSLTGVGKAFSPDASSWADKMTAKLESQDKGAKADLAASLDQTDVGGAKQLVDSVKSSTSALMQDLKQVGKTIASNILPAIKSFASMLKTAAGYAASLAKAIAKISGKAISGIGKALSGMGEKLLPESGIRRFTNAAGAVTKALGRIAFYRLIRSAIKEITQAFKEGLENAVAFSRGIEGEGQRFAAAMDSMSTSGQTMKNQLGAAFLGLLAAIEPIISAIIAAITRLADALSQLFAAFTGSTYLKAADVPKKWGEAAGGAAKKAKEWKNQLLGFDEINRLNEPSDGGGGGGGGKLDPSTMFKDSPIKENIKKFVDELKAAIKAGDWKGAGQLIGNKINELLPTPDQWKAWGSKLGYGLNGAIQTLYYTLDTIDFTAIGQGIANFLNSALEEIDFTYLGAILVKKFTLALDFLIGFLGTLDWKLVGKSVFDFLMGALREANDWLKSKDWDQIGKNIFSKFSDLISEIDFAELAKSFFTFLGNAFGALVQILDEFFKTAVDGVKKYFNEKFEECGGDVWEGFKKGIKDAAVGIGTWVQTNMIDPFVNAVKNLLGVHSPSTVFEDIGSNVVAGLEDGISGSWSGFSSTIDSLFGSLVSWCQDAHNWIQDVLDGINLIGSSGGFFSGLFNKTPKYATGGFPEDGLFFANHGEMVGQFSNGRTAVANNEQITEGIANAVYDAFMNAFSQTGGNNGQAVNIYLDGKQIAQTTTKYQKQFARAGAA